MEKENDPWVVVPFGYDFTVVRRKYAPVFRAAMKYHSFTYEEARDYADKLNGEEKNGNEQTGD